MAKGKRYTDEEKAEILDFVEKQGRGGATIAAKKYGVSVLSIGNWKRQASGDEPYGKSSASGKTVSDQETFVKVLAGKGFKYVRLVNSLTGEVVEEKSDPKIAALGEYEFKTAPKNADRETIYVSQTTPQIQITMSLDKFLALAKVKP